MHGPSICLRQVCEKYLDRVSRSKSISINTLDRHGMWHMLRVYGVGGKLLKAVQSFYVDCWACDRVGNDVSEWFPVNVRVRQGCVMSPWLFNVYMDGVVREVNVSVIDLEFVLANSKCYLKLSIIVIIGEQSSRYPFVLFLGLYPSWSF